jgi:hypothetical protein
MLSLSVPLFVSGQLQRPVDNGWLRNMASIQIGALCFEKV